jgi:hypothetical protein
MKRIALGLVALVAAVGVAYGNGQFPNYPQVGGPAYCAGFSTGPTGQVCVDNVPAGPTNLTGTSLVPADTGLAQGQQPQTVTVPAVLMSATSQDAAPLTGTSVTMGVGIAKLLLDPAGTIATLTVVLPLSPIDGQEAQISTSQTVTALTVTPGTGSTLVPTITTVTAAAPVDLVYHAATQKWVNQ